MFNTLIKQWSNNLTLDSISDICALKQISKKRIKWYIGRLDTNDIKKIDAKLMKVFNIKKQ